MKTKSVALILLLCGLASARPPDLDPNDIPFPVDPNWVGVMDYILHQDPNAPIVYDVLVRNKWGLDADVTVADVNDPNLVVTKLGRTKEPDGWKQEFRIIWTHPPIGCFPITIRATDKLGRTDVRSVIVYSVDPADAPVIDVVTYQYPMTAYMAPMMDSHTATMHVEYSGGIGVKVIRRLIPAKEPVLVGKL